MTRAQASPSGSPTGRNTASHSALIRVAATWSASANATAARNGNDHPSTQLALAARAV
jgi:hypothetical protein